METAANSSNAITPAQTQLFKLAYKASESINKAINGQLEAMKAWLKTQYGDKAPTYEQFWSDRDALKRLAQEKGLVDDQWVRKPYNMAVKAVYGDLPVSTTMEAVAKRATRPFVKAKGGKAANDPAPGKKTTVVKVVMPKDAETAVRQMLAHYGMAQILIAFSTVLSEHRATAKEAIRVKTLGDHMLANPPAIEPKPRTAMH